MLAEEAPANVRARADLVYIMQHVGRPSLRMLTLLTQRMGEIGDYLGYAWVTGHRASLSNRLHGRLTAESRRGRGG